MSELSSNDGTNNVIDGISAADDGHNLPGDVVSDEPDVLGFGSSAVGSRSRKSEAKAPVDAGALFYKMDHKRRGICLILNNEKFFIPGLKDRNGTQADRDNLITTFKGLGFEVITKDNLNCSATIKQVKEVAEMNHADCDCFVMCVLSHGEEGVIYATDAPYKHDQIFSPFTADNCPTLAGKPKLFFLQACQGSRLDAGLSMNTQVDSSPSYKIPVHADFLVAYSTIPGFYSWRNTGKGSWFVQALVLELQESGMLYDILTLLTFVNRRVAIDFESNVPDNTLMHAKKQVPFITFMLTRLVKFSFKAPK